MGANVLAKRSLAGVLLLFALLALSLQILSKRPLFESDDDVLSNVQVATPSRSSMTTAGHVIASPGPLIAQRKLAYVFYLASDQYACACLALVASLKQAGTSREHKLVALVTSNTDSTDPTWRDSLTRIQVFKMTEFDRIVVLDVDGTVLKSLDSLFDLPSAPLWAPRAFWLDPPSFQSTLYVIEPSLTPFEAQMKIVRAPKVAGAKLMYDMDIANEAFRDTVALLPGTVAVLNGVFKASPQSADTIYGTKTVEDVAANAYYAHFSESPLGGCKVTSRSS
ncbi:hypothetical protein HKX48_007870 [Thoreauomyces humboldtii]|nr:hypothetical protein HKX48_007870 [Thoreauomyces humboldtii]